MSETDAHARSPGDLDVAASTDHADHGGAHGAPEEPLGPIDSRAWAAAIGGSVMAVLVVLALALAIRS